MRVRCFLAVDLSERVCRAIGKVQNQLKPLCQKVHWVDPENFHLTLKFCGQVNEHEVVGIAAVAKRHFSEIGPLSLDCHGLGAFPSPEAKPDAATRVIWAGVVPEELPELVREFELDLMDSVGIRPETKPYLPHITIGRVKTTQNLDKLKAEIVNYKDQEFGECVVQQVHLYEIQLTPRGPVYTSLSTIPL